MLEPFWRLNIIRWFADVHSHWLMAYYDLKAEAYDLKFQNIVYYIFDNLCHKLQLLKVTSHKSQLIGKSPNEFDFWKFSLNSMDNSGKDKRLIQLSTWE